MLDCITTSAPEPEYIGWCNPINGSRKEPTTLIIGCDYHPGFQQVAIFDEQTGEIVQRRLAHPQQAMEFYGGLPAGVLVGIESTGFSGWFERLLETLGHQVWIGDATQIRASMTRKQKTDKRDAEHIVKLLVEGRFPRIWVPSAADRDARQLLVHRHKLVQWQTEVKNQLQFLALNQGLQLKWRLWTRSGRQKLEALPLASYAGERRTTLLDCWTNWKRTSPAWIRRCCAKPKRDPTRCG